MATDVSGRYAGGMGIALCAVSIALTSRRTVDLCRVGSCLCPSVAIG